MATYIDSLGERKRGQLFERALMFQRKAREASIRKKRRRLTLRKRHVLALSLLLAGIFFAVDRVYLFLITWDRLAITKVELGCPRAPLRANLERYFKTRPMGNMLLFDISLLRKQIETLAWVKDVQVQKVFPDTLVVRVDPRVPYALLEKDGIFVVDEHGIVLERAGPDSGWPFPVIKDEDGFRDRFQDKWEAARACLADLSPAQKSKVVSLETSGDGRMTLSFKDDPVRVVVDGAGIGDKLAFFDASRAEWERLFGALESVDLRLEDRVIVRPAAPAVPGPPPNSHKEAE
jgi:cell division septal protein FtsQ